MKLYILALVITTVAAYNLTCPHLGQWKIRAIAKCNFTDKYVCLWDDIKDSFAEKCTGPQPDRPGNRQVLNSGNFDRKPCVSSRFQPIHFKTYGNSGCVLKKSLCNEEGQIPERNRNTTMREDRTCRCDYTNGYSFVTTPSNQCYCIPSEEDCSCYKKQCGTGKLLSQDYYCQTESQNSYNCSDIDENTTDVSRVNTTRELKPNNTNDTKLEGKEYEFLKDKFGNRCTFWFIVAMLFLNLVLVMLVVIRLKWIPSCLPAHSLMSSTLVKTVSINYGDFNDSFLTCGTCLCVYDSTEHTPKVLPCSHTVCRSCLDRIVESQINDTGYFRCPICREHIGIPRSGEIGEAITHLKSSVTLMIVDYRGNPRTSGSDPVVVEVRTDRGEIIESKIHDKVDGTYEIHYVPTKPGKINMFVSIFNRPVKGSPFVIDVTEHNNPVMKFGYRGSGEECLLQPVRVVTNTEDSCVYVLDTGNSRIKCLDTSGKFKHHIGPLGLENQGGTGLALTPDKNLAVINWRTKYVTVMSTVGEVINKFTHQDFVEPIDIAVNSRGKIIIADNVVNRIFMFDPNGKLLTTFGSKGSKEGQFKFIDAIVVGKCDEILVADHRVQIFSHDGKFSRVIPDQGKGQFCGLAVDAGGLILATKTEKTRSYVQILNSSGKLMFNIDSYHDKLKRPSGLATTTDHHVYVVDLGNHCLKKYRYK